MGSDALQWFDQVGPKRFGPGYCNHCLSGPFHHRVYLRQTLDTMDAGVVANPATMYIKLEEVGLWLTRQRLGCMHRHQHWGVEPHLNQLTIASLIDRDMPCLLLRLAWAALVGPSAFFQRPHGLALTEVNPLTHDSGVAMLLDHLKLVVSRQRLDISRKLTSCRQQCNKLHWIEPKSLPPHYVSSHRTPVRFLTKLIII